MGTRRLGCISRHLWLLAATLLLFVEGSVEASGRPLLRIAGSSTVYPVAARWANALSANYTFTDGSGANTVCENDSTVCGGGSSVGARRVCAARDSPDKVDIGDMSRDWKEPKEVVRLDDGYTLECVDTKIRVTQLAVGIDGLAVVAGNRGPAASCLMLLGGLTLAQLRWMFSDWTDDMLQNDPHGGLDLTSVMKNDNHNGIKEWSDLDSHCEQTPINIYGPGRASGTNGFFGEVVFCEDCFAEKSGVTPERFPTCPAEDIAELEALHSPADVAAYLAGVRPTGCYMPSEDDEAILEWIENDGGGIGYLGFAYYAMHASKLAIVPIASDRVKGVEDTLDAKTMPSAYSIVDGSYAVFTRTLFMNVDNEVWPLVKDFLEFGYSAAGMALVSDIGYVTINSALRAKMISRVLSNGNPLADYVKVPEICRPGFENEGHDCVPCKVGFFAPATGSSCFPCSGGTFAAQEGQSSCDPAPAGSFVGAAGSNASLLCPAGFYTHEVGASACTGCGLGSFSSSPGSTGCSLCPRGSYADLRASSACATCRAGDTTAEVASSSVRACICPEGSFRPAGGGSCLPCPAGMVCPEGSDMEVRGDVQPAAAFGHMVLEGAPLVAYRCLVEEQCPGGPPGSCAAGRDGSIVACAACRSGHYDAGVECRPCEGAISTLLLAVALILIVAVTVVVTLVTNRDLMLQTQGGMLAMTCAGLLLTAAQTLGIFDQLSIPWMEPISSLLQVTRILNMNFEFLRSGCLMGHAPVVRYLLAQSLIVVAVSVAFVTLLVKCRFFAIKIAHEFFNTVGTVANALFIGIVVSCFAPLICYQHPGGEGASASMRSSASVLCFEGGEHSSMVAIGIIAFLCGPTPFLAAVLYGTRYFQDILTGDRSHRFLALRFLYIRFNAENFYYAPVLLTRGLLICLVPVFFQDWAMQTMLLSVILLTFHTLQARLYPWRTREANYLDSVLSFMLLILLASGSLAGAGSVPTARSCGIVSVVGIGGACTFALGVTLLRNCCTSGSRFQAFVCHHKQDGAAQARFLKMMLHEAGLRRVFIDSDDLKNLDELFDIVKTKVQKLVVFLTRDTLRRPWCAGEIVAAYSSKRAVVPVWTAAVAEPTDEQLQDLENYIDETGCCLRQYGITWAKVQEAYERLLESPRAIRFSQPLCHASWFKLLAGCIVSGGALEPKPPPLAALPSKAGRVVLSADGRDAEAVAAAGILACKMREKIFHIENDDLMCSMHHCDLSSPDLVSAIVGSARMVVVILSQGSLRSVDQLMIIAEAVEQHRARRDAGTDGYMVQVRTSRMSSAPSAKSTRSVVKKLTSSTPRTPRRVSSPGLVYPMMLPDFTFPTDDYYASTLHMLCGDEAESVGDLVKSFFKLIVVSFPTGGSDTQLEVQAAAVADRIPGNAPARALQRKQWASIQWKKAARESVASVASVAAAGELAGDGQEAAASATSFEVDVHDI